MFRLFFCKLPNIILFCSENFPADMDRQIVIDTPLGRERTPEHQNTVNFMYKAEASSVEYNKHVE